MSRHTILFFNNFSKFHGNGHEVGSGHTDSQDLNDLSSSSETSISQSLEHDLFHMERSSQAHTHDSLGKSQASPQVLKFMNYMKDLENNPGEDPFNNHIILSKEQYFEEILLMLFSQSCNSRKSWHPSKSAFSGKFRKDWE